jgi:hypothetical protein
MDKNWKISQIGFAQSKQLWKSKSLALGLVPTENQIFMACLDAHLYEIEYSRSRPCPCYYIFAAFMWTVSFVAVTVIF